MSTTYFENIKFYEDVNYIGVDGYELSYLTGDSYMFSTSGNHMVDFSFASGNIPDSMFAYCDDIITAYINEDSCEIGAYAFMQCQNLESVYIPATMAYINSYAFYDTNISYLEILATTPPTLGDNVFSTEPDYISVPTAYENDYKQASGWSEYEDVINPQPKYDIDCTFNITTTSSNTWLYSSNAVSSIDELYIDGVKQDTVVNQYQFDTTGTHKVQINLKSNITAVPTEMFASNTNLTECILSDRITSLGEYGTFRGASNLTYVNIPPLITSIGSQIFQGTKLSNVILPEGLTSLGFYAFNNCTLLSLVELPSTITSLGDGVFNNTIITSIEIPAGVTTMSSALYNCTHLETLISYAATPPTVTWHGLNNHAANRKIYVPSSYVNVYKEAQYWSTYASDIEAIPQAGYTINYSIKAIQSKDDPDYYQNIINEWAFYIYNEQTQESVFSKEAFDAVIDSISLDGVKINVETGEELRRSFTTEGLHNVELILVGPTVPSNIFSSIAIYECHVGEGITTIGPNAFCEGWQQTTGGKLYLPSTITEFQDTPFMMCGAFKLYMAGTTPPVYNVYETTDNGLFDGTSAENIIIFVPDAAVNTYKAHATWSAYASNIRGLSATKTNLSDSDFGFYNIDEDVYQDYYDAAINDPVNNTSFGLDYFTNSYNVEYTLEYDDTMFTVDMLNWFTVIDTNRWTSASNTYTITIKFNGDDAFNAKTLTYNVTTNVTTS